MTQEQAAVFFGVDARSVRRWEAGNAVPDNVQKAIQDNSPLTERMMQGLIAIVRHSEGHMLLLDDELVVIENSPPHKARMFELFGTNIVGRKWIDFMTPEARDWVAAQGGVQAMIERGFLDCTVPFRRVVQTLQGQIELAGITHQASVWLGSGTHLSIITIANQKPGEVLPATPTARFLGDEN